MRYFVALLLFLACFGCNEPMQSSTPIRSLRGEHLHEKFLLQNDLDTSYLGDYACNGYFNTAYYFTLNKNHNFSFKKAIGSCVRGNNINKIVNGCFTIDGNCLTLFPEQFITENQYAVGAENYHRDTISYTLNNETYLETDYYIVASKGIHFLLSDSYARPFASYLFNYKNKMETFAEMYLEGFHEEKYVSHVFVQHPFTDDKINLSDFDTLQIPEEYRYLFR